MTIGKSLNMQLEGLKLELESQKARNQSLSNLIADYAAQTVRIKNLVVTVCPNAATIEDGVSRLVSYSMKARAEQARLSSLLSTSEANSADLHELIKKQKEDIAELIAALKDEQVYFSSANARLIDIAKQVNAACPSATSIEDGLSRLVKERDNTRTLWDSYSMKARAEQARLSSLLSAMTDDRDYQLSRLRQLLPPPQPAKNPEQSYKDIVKGLDALKDILIEEVRARGIR